MFLDVAWRRRRRNVHPTSLTLDSRWKLENTLEPWRGGSAVQSVSMKLSNSGISLSAVAGRLGCAADFEIDENHSNTVLPWRHGSLGDAWLDARLIHSTQCFTESSSHGAAVEHTNVEFSVPGVCRGVAAAAATTALTAMSWSVMNLDFLKKFYF